MSVPSLDRVTTTDGDNTVNESDAEEIRGSLDTSNRDVTALADFEVVTGPDIIQTSNPDGPIRGAAASLSSGDAVHDALKGPEVGFKYEVSGLEKEARRLARDWAASGLPRHDLESPESNEAEVVLAQRAGEIYGGWIRRVRQKVDAAVSSQRVSLDAAIASGFRAVDGYRSAQSTLQELAPRPFPSRAAEPA